MKRRMIPALLAIAIALSACSGDADEGGEPSPSAGATTSAPTTANIEAALIVPDALAAIQEAMHGVASSTCDDALARAGGGQNIWLNATTRKQVAKAELALFESTDEHICIFLATFEDVPLDGERFFHATYNGHLGESVPVGDVSSKRLVVEIPLTD